MKTFLLLVVGAVVIGAGIAGALIAGAALSKSGTNDAPVTDFPTPTISKAASMSQKQKSAGKASIAQGPANGVGLDQQQLAQLREQMRSGNLSEEELAQLREQFQAARGQRSGQGGRGGGFEQGDIVAIEGNSISLDTQNGLLKANVGEETIVSLISALSLNDLTPGMNLSIIGSPGEGGAIEARRVTVIPGDIAEGVVGAFRGPGMGMRQGGAGTGDGRGGEGGIGGQTGHLESIDGNTITVVTPRGPIRATIGLESLIFSISHGTSADLTVGMHVQVMGRRGEDGAITARRVSVVPEGLEAGFVSRFDGRTGRGGFGDGQ